MAGSVCVASWTNDETAYLGRTNRAGDDASFVCDLIRLHIESGVKHWSMQRLDSSICAISKAASIDGVEALVLTEDGNINFVSESGRHVEHTGVEGLNILCETGDNIFAMGFDGAMIHREKNGSWSKFLSFDEEIKVKNVWISNAVPDQVGGFYFVGQSTKSSHQEGSGIIGHCDGKHISIFDASGAGFLFGLQMVSRQRILVCGWNDVILEGNKDSGFQTLSKSSFGRKLRLIASDGSRIFVANGGSWRFDASTRSFVSEEALKNQTVIDMRFSSSAIDFTCAHRLMRFEGQWSSTDIPDVIAE